MYVYQADTYCDSCGEAIRAQLRASGDAPADPDDEWSYDSDDFPKGPCAEEETDGPDHCASYGDCLEGVDLARYGLHCGAWKEETDSDRGPIDCGCGWGAYCPLSSEYVGPERTGGQRETVLVGAESRTIGVLLSDGLTDYGVDYLREMLEEKDPTPYQRALYAYWQEVFADELGEVPA